MTTLDICDDRCGRGWHSFCSQSECRHFKQMLSESEKAPKAAFITIGNAKEGAKLDD